MSADTDVEGWKQRYLDSIDQLENREREWERVEQLLRQFVSRLALAIETTDSDFFWQLDKLRSEIRSGRSSAELEGVIKSISTAILKLDDERTRQKRQPLPSEFAVELLNAIELPKGMRRRSNSLIKKLVNQGEELDAETIATDVAGFVGELLDWVVASGEPIKGQEKGLLGKLFGKSGAEEDEAGESETTGQKDEARSLVSRAEGGDDSLAVAKRLLRQIIAGVLLPGDETSSITHQVEASDRELQLQQLAGQILQQLKREQGAENGAPGQPVHEVLIQLLERLDLPGEFDTQLEKLKSELEAGQGCDIEQGVVQIADLVTRMRAQIQGERKELEDFLLQLTDRLGELDQEVQESLQLHHGSYSDGQDLNRDVNEQMERIESSVNEVQELSILKDVIQQRVDIIRQKMEEFRDSEEERLKIAESKVELLSSRLSRMEKETSVLRQRVETERRQSLVDSLTGIGNRLAYDERVEQEYRRFRRYATALTLCIWDIDRFKRVNDSYGHQAGDKVLGVISKLLKKQVRETDFLARYGGEEFVLLLPETTQEEACTVVEMLRKSVEQCEFHFRDEPVPITISCGVSQFREGDTPEMVFERADKALYSAKEQGRNRYICS